MTLGAGLSTGLQIASFGQDTDGEIYIVHLGGTLHRLVQGTGGGPPDSSAALADRLRELRQSHAAGQRSHSLRAQRAVLLRRRRQGALAGAARWSTHRHRRQQRFRFPEWQRAGEELQSRRHAGRDATVHASQRRQTGLAIPTNGTRAAPTPRAWSAARPCRSQGKPGISRAKRNACNAIRRRPDARSGSRSDS